MKSSPEIFKPIRGYEGRYLVSNRGKILSLTSHCGIGRKFPLTISGCNCKGYRSIILQKDRVRKTFRVHRVVAEAFIPNPKQKLEINHKNGTKHDNRIENLEWVTRLENAQHANKTGLYDPMKRFYEIIFPNGRVECIRGLKGFSRKHNVNDSHMREVAIGERSHHKNFKCKEITKPQEVLSEIRTY